MIPYLAQLRQPFRGILWCTRTVWEYYTASPSGFSIMLLFFRVSEGFRRRLTGELGGREGAQEFISLYYKSVHNTWYSQNVYTFLWVPLSQAFQIFMPLLFPLIPSLAHALESLSTGHRRIWDRFRLVRSARALCRKEGTYPPPASTQLASVQIKSSTGTREHQQ